MSNMSTQGFTAPSVGDGATLHYPSDCYPFTVIGRTPSGKTIQVQADKATRTDSNGPFSESQTYAYEPDTEARVEVYTWRRSRRAYVLKGADNRSAALVIGARRKYLSPSV